MREFSARERAVVAMLVCLSACAGCAGASLRTSSVSATADKGAPGPTVAVTVADFEVKAAKATQETGAGLRSMLIAALTGSERYRIIERQPIQEAAGSPPADVVVSAAVVAFEPLASGGSAGIGGGGGSGSGIMGGLLGRALDKAHVALELRIIDAKTSEILAASKVQGQASDIAGGLSAQAAGFALAQTVSVYANTPMEKAIRICVMEAVRYISQAVPESYYKN